MATPRSQRIGIWIIAIVLTMGTLGSFLVMALSNQNQAADQAHIQKLSSDYQAKLTVQAKQLSDKYYPVFSQYESTPAVFSPDGITAVSTNDLQIGDGAVLTATTEYSAYYIGWNPKGVIFDQSINSATLKAPIAGGNLIAGWNEGVVGMKIGGVREITIPSDKAYGANGQGENIPSNTPLKFIVMAIPKVADIPVPAELLQLYQSQQAPSS